MDDDEDHLVLTRTRLERHPARRRFRLETARSGPEALERLLHLRRSQGRILVLSDYRMPGMDGLALLRAVRAAHPRDDVPFVLFTSVEQPTLALAGAGQGADGLLVKPVDGDEFRRALHALVDRWAPFLEARAPKPLAAPA